MRPREHYASSGSPVSDLTAPLSLGWGRVSTAPGGEVRLGWLGAQGWGQGLAESGLRPGAEPAGTCLLAATDRPARGWLSEGVRGFRVLFRLPP